MEEMHINAIPFAHKDLEVWRDNFKGVEVHHEPTGMTISGAIDDVWINDEGALHVVDYKATSKDGEVNLDAEWQDGYKRQMEVYEWLLRMNGHTVSDTGYFVYVNGRTDVDTFDGKLEFEIKIIPYEGSDSWIEEKLSEIKTCLESGTIPKEGSACDYCPYRSAAGKALLKVHTKDERSSKKKLTPPIDDDQTPTLF